jgi:hypothetical protein
MSARAKSKSAPMSACAKSKSAPMSACAKSKRPGLKVEHRVASQRESLFRQDEAHGEEPGGRLSVGG